MIFERLALFPMIFPMVREESEGNNKETPDIRPHGLATEFSALFDQPIVSTILQNSVAKTRRRDMSQYHGWRAVELIPVLGTNPECDLAEVACTPGGNARWCLGAEGFKAAVCRSRTRWLSF